jgi:four helix bundle protein
MEPKKYLSLDDLRIYQEAMLIGKRIWDYVVLWNYFEKDTLGKQFVRAADSIALNIAEGYGRFSYNENRQFCRYARGSLLETKSCLQKAIERNLVNETDGNDIMNDLSKLHLHLNNYMKTIGNTQ